MARDRPGTSSQKKRRTKKRREEKWEAIAVTTLLKAAQTPWTCGSLFASDILSRKYCFRPSYHRREEPSGVNIVGHRSYRYAVHHDDSLKDILDDRLSGRANNGVVRWHSGLARVVRTRVESKDSAIPSSLECIIKIPRNRSARACTHTCCPAACFVSCPDDFKLRRYRRTISATVAEVPARPGLRNPEYGSFQARYPRYQRRTPIFLEPAWFVSFSFVHEKKKNSILKDR